MNTKPVEKLNLRTYAFPPLSGVDIAFSTLQTDPVLLAEAKARGFLMHSSNPYCAMFSKLFFQGGKIKFKANLPEPFKTNATRYLRAFMGSFEPRHEDKEAICALLLSELADV